MRSTVLTYNKLTSILLGSQCHYTCQEVINGSTDPTVLVEHYKTTIILDAEPDRMCINVLEDGVSAQQISNKVSLTDMKWLEH